MLTRFSSNFGYGFSAMNEGPPAQNPAELVTLLTEVEAALEKADALSLHLVAIDLSHARERLREKIGCASQ